MASFLVMNIFSISRAKYAEMEKIMPNKNKVEVTIKGKSNKTTIVGGSKGYKSSGNSINKIKADIDGENLETGVIGGDTIDNIFDELSQLLIPAIYEEKHKKYVEQILSELKKEFDNHPDARKESKNKMLLSDLTTYIGLASLATEQVEKVKTLINHITKLLGF